MGDRRPFYAARSCFDPPKPKGDVVDYLVSAAPFNDFLLVAKAICEEIFLDACFAKLGFEEAFWIRCGVGLGRRHLIER